MLTYNSSAPTEVTKDPTSEAALWLGTVLLKYCLNTSLALCAVVNNTINMIVFCRLGITTGINQNFLLLSVSDSLYGIIQTILCGGLIGNELGWWTSRLLPSSFYKLGFTISSVPHFASIILTTVIAIIRCYSVVMPLKVKVNLTPRRQLAIILLPFCIYIGFSSNVFFCLGLTWHFNSVMNFSQLTLTPCREFSGRQRLLDFCRSLLLYTAFTTVAVCLVVLLLALKHSSRFKGKKSSASANNRRDIQVIKTVILVSAIFVFCNLPAMAVAFMRQMWPSFKLRGQLGRSFQLALLYLETNTLVNACSNILVFYSSSSLYRKAFHGMFHHVEKNP
ncbi:chemosensory receptor A [Elysia marginata]|uniref:Chemosensory receptor A n=1 Tax=Elysia marginata TaxID=1093978 RepID=A0AAV4HNW6_9GAST|nr:chemosensory receptor A [Elysia marginata]